MMPVLCRFLSDSNRRRARHNLLSLFLQLAILNGSNHGISLFIHLRDQVLDIKWLILILWVTFSFTELNKCFFIFILINITATFVLKISGGFKYFKPTWGLVWSLIFYLPIIYLMFGNYLLCPWEIFWVRLNCYFFEVGVIFPFKLI